MIWSFSLICNQCPREVCKLQNSKDLNSALSTVVPLRLLFGPCVESIRTPNEDVISGICIFKNGHHPTWEACPSGGEYAWRGLLDEKQLVSLFEVVSTWTSSQPEYLKSIVGIRLINKNKHNLPLLKLEFWCSGQLTTNEVNALNTTLQTKVHMVGLEQMKYTSHAAKSQYSKRRSNRHTE